MDAVFLKLLNMSLAASWVVLAVVLLRQLLKKAPKWINCLLWALVAVRLVCPFSLESALSLIPSAEPLPQDIIYGRSFDINTGIDFVDVPLNDYLSDRYYEGVTVPADNGSYIMTVLACLWLVGMAAMTAYAIVSYLRLRKKVDACIRVSDNVRICDYIETPFILGIRKPVIYLPTSMEPDAAEYVLAHERAHLKRRDHWWKPIGFLLLTVHWFNPLMWLAYILLCRDIELACDEKVIRDMNGEQKRSYSEALLNCSMPRYLIAACPLAFGEVGVKERVKSVLNYKKPAFWLVLAAVLVCIAVAVCFLTDPVGLTLGKLWDLTDGEYSSVTVTAGEDTVVLNHEAEIDQVLEFLDSAKVNPDPVSQNRIERASDYEIILSGAESKIRICFDVFFADVWMDNGVEPSLPYFMKDADQVKAFFERIIGKTIEAVHPTEAECGFAFDAVILQITEGSILVCPVEGSSELSSADQIWVRTSDLPAEAVAELGVGDGVCIVYDGMIAETYPAQITTVYDIRPTVDRISTRIRDLYEITAEYAHENVRIQLSLPMDWEYEIEQSSDDAMNFGICFRPCAEDSGWLHLNHYASGFAVCGTGLETESGGFPSSGYLYTLGYYDDSSEWSHLAFQGMYRNFAVINEAGEWFPEYEDQIMAILDTAVLTVDK